MDRLEYSNPFIDVEEAGSSGQKEESRRVRQGRGPCLLTAKVPDLWKPLPGVDEEDIRHMKRRVLIFNCTETIAQLKETAAEALSIPTLPRAPPGHQHEPVQGLAVLAAGQFAQAKSPAVHS